MGEGRKTEVDAWCLRFLLLLLSLLLLLPILLHFFLFFKKKARVSPDAAVLFINSFSRAVKNQCALHCKQFIMMGDGRNGVEGRKREGEKKLNCNRIDLFKYNNTALCSGSGGGRREGGGGGRGSGGQTKTEWQQRADKLLQTRDTHRNVV